jgi:hypothetical protein
MNSSALRAEAPSRRDCFHRATTSTESSQRVGIRHLGQPTSGAMARPHLRIQNGLSHAGLAALIPAEAMPDVRWYQQ